jgi:hypothetical protein
MSQLVFIDDSGDPGFKIGKGSTSHFVISCVIFEDDLEALKVKVAIKELKRELGFPDEVEFKFFRSKNDTKIKFLRKVNRFNFNVRSIVVDKSKIWSDELKNNKNSFYSYIIKLVLQHSDDTILDAKIRIDGSGDRIFRRSFLTYLRKQLNSDQKKVIKNCKLLDSKSDELIQMADMIAGSVRRSYDRTKEDSATYKKIINKHISNEWEFK